jgi:hypothetical protein
MRSVKSAFGRGGWFFAAKKLCEARPATTSPVFFRKSRRSISLDTILTLSSTGASGKLPA